MEVALWYLVESLFLALEQEVNEQAIALWAEYESQRR